MVPELIGSSRLIVRHSVDLPEPDGPITTTTSPRPTDSETSSSTCSGPNHLLTASSTMSGSPVVTSSTVPCRLPDRGRLTPGAATVGGLMWQNATQRVTER